MGLTDGCNDEVSEKRGVVLIEHSIVRDRLAPGVDEVEDEGPDEEHQGEHNRCGRVSPPRFIDGRSIRN